MSSNSSHAHAARGGFLTIGASRKRKERELSFDAFNNKKASTSASTCASTSTSTTTIITANNSNKAEPMVINNNGSLAASASDNRLLAGYLAHEFLTKGTLLGQKWDPARAEAAPVVSSRNNNNTKGRAAGSGAGASAGAGAGEKKAVVGVGKESYAEVAKLMKRDGTHLPGIVNPTQLARWLQM